MVADKGLDSGKLLRTLDAPEQGHRTHLSSERLMWIVMNSMRGIFVHTKILIGAALYICATSNASGRTPVVDFLDPSPLLQEYNQYCENKGGCFDVGSRYEEEWLVRKFERKIEIKDGSFLLHWSSTYGSIVPNRFDTFRPTTDTETGVIDLASQVLEQRFTPYETRHTHMSRVLIAIAKGWSHEETFDFFCPPINPFVQAGDPVFDWCVGAERFIESLYDDPLHDKPLAIAQELIESYCDEPVSYQGIYSFRRSEMRRIRNEIGSNPNDLFVRMYVNCDSWNSSWYSSPWQSTQCSINFRCMAGIVGVAFSQSPSDNRWQMIAYFADTTSFETLMLDLR